MVRLVADKLAQLHDDGSLIDVEALEAEHGDCFGQTSPRLRQRWRPPPRRRRRQGPRPRPRSRQPQVHARDVDQGEVVAGCLLEARCNRAVALEAMEEDLDEVALPEAFSVEWQRAFAFGA